MLMTVLIKPMGKKTGKWLPSLLQTLLCDWDKLEGDGLGHSPYQGNLNPANTFNASAEERDASEFGHVGFTSSCGHLIFSPRKSDGIDSSIFWKVGWQGLPPL